MLQIALRRSRGKNCNLATVRVSKLGKSTTISTLHFGCMVEMFCMPSAERARTRRGAFGWAGKGDSLFYLMLNETHLSSM